MMRTLLLADDSKTTLAVEKAFLEARSLRVFATESASEVPKLAGVVQPDLIVLDYEMPDLKGDEVCRLLKQQKSTRHIPVLVLSGHEDERIRRACVEAGAAGFLAKREGREALLDRVAELLGLRQRRHVRAACRLAAAVECGSETIDGVIHNLSAGGVYLTLGRSLPVGAPLWIGFKLPDTGFAVRVFSEVVRAETLSGSMYAYGVQLIQADEEVQAAIAGFVQRASLLPEAPRVPGR